jgi:hypothetical protein
VLDVDAFEEVVERALFEYDHGRIVHRLGNAEQATIHTFVKHAQTGSVEEENLQCGSSLAEEHEHRARASGAAHALFRETGESVEAEAHVDGLERDEDLDAVRDHRAVPPSAWTTARSIDGSNPGMTSMRVVPTVIVIELGGVRGDDDVGRDARLVCGIVDATTRANRTFGLAALVFAFRPDGDGAIFPARPRRLDHESSAPALKPLPGQ